MEFFVGLPDLDGVIGKGIANSRDFLVGDFVGDFEGERVGEPGVARIVAEEGDFGEAEARRRVSVDGLATVGSAGRSAAGILGIGESPECS